MSLSGLSLAGSLFSKEDSDLARASREFQIFAKPAGPICNLDCHYCYYLKKEQLYSAGGSFCMSEDVLEQYIVQHIDASPESLIRFSWHGGEPTVLGLDYFRKIVALQRKHKTIEPAHCKRHTDQWDPPRQRMVPLSWSGRLCCRAQPGRTT